MPSMIKPRTLGVLTKAERTKTGASYIVSALGMFDLAQPAATRFETEQALWLLAAKALPKGAALDIAMPKPRAELLLGGAARAPEGQPTTAMAVEWSVGPLSKRLVVFGDRYWTIAGHGYAATPPRPFVEVPLSPERAFGGEGHADNPQGMGHRAAARIRAGEFVALPNVEYADQLVLTTESRPEPALCGPIDLASPKRRRYAGTYDRHWIKNIAPALPDDVDPRYFLNAPEDQIFPDYLKGGEPYALRGFSPDHPEMRGTLPSFRVRCFLARKGQGGAPDELVEMAMRIDTLWLFAGARRGVLIYRGALPVTDVDAEDLSAVMLAYERAADEPRSFESYVEVWKLRRDRKSAFKYAFAESQLAPALSPETIARRNDERAAQSRERLERHYEGMNWLKNRRLDEAAVPEEARPGASRSAFDEDIVNLPQPTSEEIEDGDIDLAGLLDGMEALEKKLSAKSDALLEKAKEVQQSAAAMRAPGAGPEAVDALFAALDALSGGDTANALDGGIASISAPSAAAAADPKSAVDTKSGADADAAVERIKSWRQTIVEAMGPQTVDDEKEFEAARARFLDLPEGRPLIEARRALEALEKRPPELPAFEGAAERVGEARLPTDLDALLDGLDSQVAAQHSTSAAAAPVGPRAQTAEIDERLRAVLPNLPSEGSALDALLAAFAKPPASGDPQEHARTAVETQTRQLGAALTALDAQEADMIKGLAAGRRSSPEPTYPRTPLGPAFARRFGELVISERHGGLSLRGRDFAGADLSGADLSGADLEGALLERANLTGARLVGARLVGAALAGVTLDGADLTDADLTDANLSKCRAIGGNFTRCRLTGGLLLEANFSGSKLHGAQLEKIQIMKSAFDAADFSGAKLSKISLIQTSMARTIWNGADLDTMSFLDLSLASAQFRGARLFRCVVLKANVSDSDFEAADLTRSCFIGDVDLTGARFVHATGLDSTFHEVKLVGANFEESVFNRTVFVKSDLTAANFRRASLKGSMFGGAKLPGADFVAANLFKGQLRRADLSGARLIGANLYGADLDHTILTAADLTGANLDRTFLAVDSNVA